jgi:AraC-like DNA-binding protein
MGHEMAQTRIIRRLEGYILESFQDLNGQMGFAYFRGLDFTFELPRMEKPVIIAPMKSAVIRIEAENLPPKIESTSQELLVLPGQQQLRVKSGSPHAEFALLLPDRGLRDRTWAFYDLPTDEAEKVFRKIRRLSQTQWIRELIFRYHFERFVAQARDNINTDFLEMELVKEIFYFFSEKSLTRKGRPHFYQLSEILQKTIAYMESHLSEELDLDRLAYMAATSKSTLVRAFSRELGTSPAKFLWNRRLEEARALLENKELSVNAVSELVGFMNAASFTRAFKKAFGQTPREVAEAGLGKESIPGGRFS